MTMWSPGEIRAFRNRMGLNKREFSERLNVSRMTVYRWERGESRPQPVHQDQLFQLAKKHNREATR